MMEKKLNAWKISPIGIQCKQTSWLPFVLAEAIKGYKPELGKS